MRTAFLAGASGLTGGHCLNALLHHPEYDKVIVLVRKPLAISHKKLHQQVGSFEKLNKELAGIYADDVFCCLGTTIKKAGSRDAFLVVDFTYPVTLAEAMVKNGSKQFLMISALGANVRSRIFYNRVKGDVERAVSLLPYQSVHLFRPSLLLGDRSESRAGEKAAVQISEFLAPFLIGPLARVKPIKAHVVGEVMVKVALQNKKGIHIYSSSEISKISS